MKPSELCKFPPRLFNSKGWGVDTFINSSSLTDASGVAPLGRRVGEVVVFDKEKASLSFDVETVKVLYFGKDRSCSSHFHVKKEELFFMVSGELEVTLIRNAEKETLLLKPGDCLLIQPGMIHQMKGVEEENVLLEISTQDRASDSYRIEKGD